MKYITAETIKDNCLANGLINELCSLINNHAFDRSYSWRGRAERQAVLDEMLSKGYVILRSDNEWWVDGDGDVSLSWAKFSFFEEGKTTDTLQHGSYFKGDILSVTTDVQPQQPKKASEKMSKVADKTKVVGSSMVSANKAALGMVTQMQVGRTNNKAIKEAVRPLVKLMFKPSFMQRLLAKVFKRENPIDTFLDSPYGSLFSAQLAHAVVELKGVENEKVRQVTVGGIAYAYNELGDLIPVESAIDSVIKSLTDAADKIVK